MTQHASIFSTIPTITAAGLMVVPSQSPRADARFDVLVALEAQLGMWSSHTNAAVGRGGHGRTPGALFKPNKRGEDSSFVAPFDTNNSLQTGSQPSLLADPQALAERTPPVGVAPFA